MRPGRRSRELPFSCAKHLSSHRHEHGRHLHTYNNPCCLACVGLVRPFGPYICERSKPGGPIGKGSDGQEQFGVRFLFSEPLTDPSKSDDMCSVATVPLNTGGSTWHCMVAMSGDASSYIDHPQITRLLAMRPVELPGAFACQQQTLIPTYCINSEFCQG